MSTSLFRTNQWEVILYKENLDLLPFNFFDYLIDKKIPCILSPLHQLDRFNEVDEFNAKKEIDKLISAGLESSEFKELERLKSIKSGNYKKPHYHLIVSYGAGANKTAQQVREDFIIDLKGKYFPRPVGVLRGAVRYLIHLDYPDKAQYRLDEVRLFNGFDVKDFFDFGTKEENEMFNSILSFIEEKNICDYYNLVLMCSDYQPWLNYVSSHTHFFKPFLTERKTFIYSKF